MNYRVFVTRHFTDVCYFDIESPTSKRAENAARKAAEKLRNCEQSRAVATDNTWISDDAVKIDHIGYPNPDLYNMQVFSRSKGITVWKNSID